MSNHPPTVSTTSLPAGRGCVNDIAVLALDIPLFPVDRLMRLDAVAAARSAAAVRIGWAAIFLKAYALVTDEMPARLARPDTMPLPLLQQSIDQFVTRPVDQVFARQLQLEGVPGWLRRTILRWNMRSAAPKRATRIGTFSLSTLAGFSATNRFHPTICTTSLSYGPLDGDGRCIVTVIADHRVLDGATAAKALARLEEVLATEIVAELRTARPVPAGAAA